MIEVYVYVQDTMADWEAGFIMAELKTGRFFRKGAPEVRLTTVGISLDPVTTMGGLNVVPEGTLDDVVDGVDTVLILPGSDRWIGSDNSKVVDVVGRALSSGGTVCAICAATAVLAQNGMLDYRRHTSNGPGFLEMFAPGYTGSEYFVNEPAVSDGNVITAGSHGGLLWAKLILEHMGVFSGETLDHWYRYFSTGDVDSYYAMVDSVDCG